MLGEVLGYRVHGFPARHVHLRAAFLPACVRRLVLDRKDGPNSIASRRHCGQRERLPEFERAVQRAPAAPPRSRIGPYTHRPGGRALCGLGEPCLSRRALRAGVTSWKACSGRGGRCAGDVGVGGAAAGVGRSGGRVL